MCSTHPSLDSSSSILLPAAADTCLAFHVTCTSVCCIMCVLWSFGLSIRLSSLFDSFFSCSPSPSHEYSLINSPIYRSFQSGKNMHSWASKPHNPSSFEKERERGKLTIAVNEQKLEGCPHVKPFDFCCRHYFSLFLFDKKRAIVLLLHVIWTEHIEWKISDTTGQKGKRKQLFCWQVFCMEKRWFLGSVCV